MRQVTAWRIFRRMGSRPAIALTVAGSDSGGGAGVQGDLKTFMRFGVYGTSVVTAVTAQNTLGVVAWEPVSAAMVRRQLDAVAEDLRPAAVKCGMLGTAENVEVVAARLRSHSLAPLVVDPVMRATSGDRLIDAGATEALVRCLLPQAALVTPNLDEASALLGEPVADVTAMERAARRLVQTTGARAALVKGGHLAGTSLVDVLYDGQRLEHFVHPRLETSSTHGTGCTLSAAITASLALGLPLREAVRRALDYVPRAIASAPGLGAGHGPLNHGA